MKIPLLALLAVSLAGRSVAAIHSPTLEALRELGGAGDATFEKTKYRLEPKEPPPPPSRAPHLTDQQKAEILRIFAGGKDEIPPGMTPRIVMRTMDLLDKVDMLYKRPIRTEEWDRRIADMRKSWNESYGDALPPADKYEEAVNAALAGFVKNLGDPHTNFMDQAEFKALVESMQGGFAGIGADVEQTPLGVKVSPRKGSPAEKAGLKDGDVITHVDGRSVVGTDINQVVPKLRGAPNTKVRVRLAGRRDEIVITRGIVPVPNSFSKMAAPGIGYVHLSGYQGDEKEFFAHVDKVIKAGAKKLILDLRWNPGGQLDMGDSITSEFLQPGQHVRATRVQGAVQQRSITTESKYPSIPLVVLTSWLSASASEITAAALQEHKRATIVGERTCGKGTFQTVAGIMVLRRMGFMLGDRFIGTTQPVPDGTGLRITTGGWETGAGTHFEKGCDTKDDEGSKPWEHATGVVPDVPVQVSMEEGMKVRSSLYLQLNGKPAPPFRDSVLEKGIEVLKSK